MPEAAIQPTKPTRRYQCRHIFTDGHRCGSPSLRHEEFCYYHHTSRRTVQQQQEGRDRFTTYDFPRLEDRRSVLLAVEEVLQRLAACAIDTRRAGLILYGLQTAVLALAKTEEPARDPAPVEEIIQHPTLGTIAPRAVVTAEGEPQPILEAEDLTEAEAKAAEAAKPKGFAAMSQEEIENLYEQHTAKLLNRKPTPQPAILATINATSAQYSLPSPSGSKHRGQLIRIAALLLGSPRLQRMMKNPVLLKGTASAVP